jgi:hypothetical protein
VGEDQAFWLVATLDCDKFKCEEKIVCRNAVFHLNRAFIDSRSSALSLNKKAFIIIYYNYKFSVALKMLCTPWPRNPWANFDHFTI